MLISRCNRARTATMAATSHFKGLSMDRRRDVLGGTREAGLILF